MSFSVRVAGLIFTLIFAGACSTRETQTPRTSSEQFLISLAAERAISQFDEFVAELKGKRVALDSTYFESVDKPFVLSALRHHINERGALLVPLAPRKVKDKDGKEQEIGPERIIEVRSGALGINDDDFGFGVPALPFPIPTTNLTTVSPELYLINRRKQQGYAKLEIAIYDPGTKTYIGESKKLWGRCYYTRWWFLFLGPFDFSHDIYPDYDEVEEPDEDDES